MVNNQKRTPPGKCDAHWMVYVHTTHSIMTRKPAEDVRMTRGFETPIQVGMQMRRGRDGWGYLSGRSLGCIERLRPLIGT